MAVLAALPEAPSDARNTRTKEPRQRRQFSDSFKAKVAREYHDGVSVSVLMKRHGIAGSMVHRWAREFPKALASVKSETTQTPPRPTPKVASTVAELRRINADLLARVADEAALLSSVRFLAGHVAAE